MKNKEKIFISTLLIISAVIWMVIIAQIVNAKEEIEVPIEVQEEDNKSYEYLSLKEEIQAPYIRAVKNEKVEEKYYSMKITHYSAKCEGCIGFTKHLEYDVRKTTKYKGMRVIAVDPRVIPLGSIVEMQLPSGTIKAIALDIGGAIKGSRIDLLVSSEREALNLGVYKNVKVKIIGKI